MAAPNSRPDEPITPGNTSHLFSITAVGRITPFLCPGCPNTALEVGKLKGAEVCYCPSCLSFVVDSASCGRLINEFRAEYQGADETPPLLDHSQMDVRTKCPACHDPMEVHPYYGPGNAVIDSCMHCKLVWFNAGELDRIIKAPGLRQQLIRCEVSTRIEPAAFMDSSAQDLDRGSTALDFAATLFQALIR